MTDESLLNPDAARYIGVRPATLNNWRSQGRGPAFIKLGSRVVYRRSELDRYLAANVRRSTADVGAA